MLMVGQFPRYDIEVRNDADVLTNATVVCTATRPDGTTVNCPATNDGTGLYHVNVALDQSGRWTLLWLITGAVVNAKADVLDVASQTPVGLLGLDDAKDQVNISRTNHDTDAELQIFVDAVTSSIEFACGPVIKQTITEILPGDEAISLSHYPVISVTSIASVYLGGPTYTGSDVWVNPKSGVVRLKTRMTNFYSGPFTVIYVVGRPDVPISLHLAARIIIQHLWTTQRGGSKRSALGGDETTQPPGFAFAIPNRAAELMDPYIQSGGFA